MALFCSTCLNLSIFWNACRRQPPPQAKKKGRRRLSAPEMVFPRVRQFLQERAASRPHDINIVDLRLHTNPARRVGDCYQKVAPLGKGAFASVFKVRGFVTGQHRALKILRKEREAEKLATEVEVMLMLDHPNVVKFYDFFEQQETICVIMELCDGGDFNHLMDELGVGRCSREELRVLVGDVTSGVAYCHRIGVAHRDLKPDNCLLSVGSSRRAAKVIDFGLSAIRRRGDEQGNEAWLSKRLGTKLFAAPEVWKEARYGVKCDVWSLGVLLYFLLTGGEHPFVEDFGNLTSRGLKHLIVAGQLREGPLEAHSVEPEARELLGKLLVLDPGDRIEAAGALGEPWLRPAPPEEEHSTASTAQRQQQPAACTAPAELLRQLALFRELSPFARAARMVMAQHVELADAEPARQAFLALDMKDELARTLSLADDPEEVSWAEWLSASLLPSTMLSKTATMELFLFLDADGDNKISLSELGRVVGDTEAGRVLEKCRKTRSGSLSLRWGEDFQEVVAEQVFGSRGGRRSPTAAPAET